MVDWASRKVLATKLAITLEACHAVDVLQEALTRHGAPEIINTDRGSQFTVEEFVRAVHDRGCRLSMDGRGAWRDNVFVKRLWRSVKYEEVYLHAYDSVNEAPQIDHALFGLVQPLPTTLQNKEKNARRGLHRDAADGPTGSVTMDRGST